MDHLYKLAGLLQCYGGCVEAPPEFAIDVMEEILYPTTAFRVIYFLV
jgi:hypothetical protein